MVFRIMTSCVKDFLFQPRYSDVACTGHNGQDRLCSPPPWTTTQNIRCRCPTPRPTQSTARAIRAMIPCPPCLFATVACPTTTSHTGPRLPYPLGRRMAPPPRPRIPSPATPAAVPQAHRAAALEPPPPPRLVVHPSRRGTTACPPRPPGRRPAGQLPTAAATDGDRCEDTTADAATRRPLVAGAEVRRRPPARPRHVRAQPVERGTDAAQSGRVGHRSRLTRCGRTPPLPPPPPYRMAPPQRRCGQPSVHGGRRGSAAACRRHGKCCDASGRPRPGGTHDVWRRRHGGSGGR